MPTKDAEWWDCAHLQAYWSQDRKILRVAAKFRIYRKFATGLNPKSVLNVYFNFTQFYVDAESFEKKL